MGRSLYDIFVRSHSIWEQSKGLQIETRFKSFKTDTIYFLNKGSWL